MTPQGAFRIRGARTLHTTGFLRLEEVEVETPNGQMVRRQVVRHPGAVAMVAVVDDAVVLIRQYRAPVDEYVLELPAGKLDIAGEDPAVAAKRELEEEVGLRPNRIEELATFYTGPGFTDEHMTVFLATECAAVALEPHGAEEEYAEIVRVPVAELPHLLASSELRDAKTIAGLYAFLARR